MPFDDLILLAEIDWIWSLLIIGFWIFGAISKYAKDQKEKRDSQRKRQGAEQRASQQDSSPRPITTKPARRIPSYARKANRPDGSAMPAPVAGKRPQVTGENKQQRRPATRQQTQSAPLPKARPQTRPTPQVVTRQTKVTKPQRPKVASAGQVRSPKRVNKEEQKSAKSTNHHNDRSVPKAPGNKARQVTGKQSQAKSKKSVSNIKEVSSVGVIPVEHSCGDIAGVVVKELTNDRDSLIKAFVYSEIVGKPVGMRDL